MQELFRETESLQANQDKLRQNFKRIFWDCDVNRLDFDKHYKTIITQVINYGYPDEIQVLFRIYAEETIRDVLKNPVKGVWEPKIYQAFCKLLDVEPKKQAINFLFVEKKTRKKINSLFSCLLNS